MSIKKIFFKSAGLSAVSSVINLAVTVLMVRWYGEALYSSYIVDLAMLSIVLIIIEAVPNSYAVHYVQDNPEWINFIAAHVFYSAIILAGVSYLIGIFFAKNFSFWMCLYVFSVAYKRYIDIRLQSTGKLDEFFWLEFCASVIKLGALAVMYLFEYNNSNSIWVALAIANVFCFSAWFLFNGVEIMIFSTGLKINFIKCFFGEINKFKNYYYGTFLKKLKDNILPLVANFFIKNSAELAAFFLAYRGVVFSVGQIRIMEALLNNKNIIRVVENKVAGRKHIVAALAFIFCFCASIFICYLSGVNFDYEIIFAMSLLIIPKSYQIFERAKAYAAYAVNSVNLSMVSYIVFLIFGGGLLDLFTDINASIFSLLVVGAEISCLAAMLAYKKLLSVRY